MFCSATSLFIFHLIIASYFIIVMLFDVLLVSICYAALVQSICCAAAQIAILLQCQHVLEHITITTCQQLLVTLLLYFNL